MQAERRVHRSANTREALTFQLAATAERTACRSLVLAERGGLMIAEVGGDTASEEIAALAPTLAPGVTRWHGTIPTSAGDRLVTVTPVASALGPLFLCAVGGLICVLGPELSSGGQGVVRILS